MTITRKTAHSEMELHKIKEELSNAGFEMTDSYGTTWEYTNYKLSIVVLLTISDFYR